MSLDQADRTPKLQPNSRNCFGCGMENPAGLALRVYTVAPGEVRAAHTLDKRFEGFPGIAHGGIVAVLLDEIVARCAMTMDENRFMLTAKLELRYRAPVPIGVELNLSGSLTGSKGRLVFAHAELRLPDDTLAADAEATLAEYPGLPETDERLKRLGWQVYPMSTNQGR